MMRINFANGLLCLTFVVGLVAPVYAEDEKLDPREASQELMDAAETLRADFSKLPPATMTQTKMVDKLIKQVASAMEFTATSLKDENTDLAVDGLLLSRAMLHSLLGRLPESFQPANQAPSWGSDDRVRPANSVTADNTAAMMIGGVDAVSPSASKHSLIPKGALSEADVRNIKAAVVNMAAASRKKFVQRHNVVSKVKAGGYDVDGLGIALASYGMDIEGVLQEPSIAQAKLEQVALSLKTAMNNPEMMQAFSSQASAIMTTTAQQMRTVTTTISRKLQSTLSNAGRLNSLANRFGFSSFSAALDAYNRVYGTNYNASDFTN